MKEKNRYSSAERSRLNTFVPPRPHPGLIKTLIWVNRWLNLYGIPLLRDIPYLNMLPLIRGLCDIRRFDLPDADLTRLKAVSNGSASAFITPNHPEFFTDWMIDKELAARSNPLMANWATHTIVNGMGEKMQAFWLANNLIAQVPGNTEDALAYSLKTAQSGTPVLLHPEGNVYWQSDFINPLFQGVANMALAAAKSDDVKPVLIAPVIWKLKFIRDERRALHAEMGWVEHTLGIREKNFLSLPLRLARLYQSVLKYRFERLGFAPPAHLHYFDGQNLLLEKLLTSLKRYGTFSGSLEDAAREMIAAVRRAEKNGETIDRMTDIRRKELALILRTPHKVYQQERWQQEHIAECLKRLRCDHVAFGAWPNKVHQLIPRPVGGRIAHIRIPEALDVRALLTQNPALDAAGLSEVLHGWMQQALDELNREIAQQNVLGDYANPFVM